MRYAGCSRREERVDIIGRSLGDLRSSFRNLLVPEVVRPPVIGEGFGLTLRQYKGL